jgi:SAM-dependent methyltransferase
MASLNPQRYYRSFSTDIVMAPPVALEAALKWARWQAKRMQFWSSELYWERRYRRGRTSGSGSEGANARFKADFLNAFVREHRITTVLELGCGDGRQLILAEYPDYVGVDVSPTAIRFCKERIGRIPGRRFHHSSERNAWALPQHFDLTLSLDVIYHLIEDDMFDAHMRDLFSCSRRFVVIYSWNFAETDEAYVNGGYVHIRRRRFTDWVEANASSQWGLTSVTDHPEAHMPSFFVFEKRVDPS